MKLLYLCNKHTYDTKMSRVRFHGMKAISKVADVKWSGLNWPDWDNNLTVQQNIDKIYSGEAWPQLVIAYKPLELKEFHRCSIPKCMRYNEMWDKRWTSREIKESASNLIICHHLNDIPNYKDALPNVKFVNVSHCAEKTFFKDWKEPKQCDVLLSGAVSRYYPFRQRLHHLIHSKLHSVVSCKILSHPGGDLKNLRSRSAILAEYSKEINRAKINLTCSSKFKYRLGKYIEIPMSGSLLAADLPDEDQDFFKQFMLVLSPSDSDDTLVQKIVHYVKNDDERQKLVDKGIELNRQYTQEDYARRFINEVETFLREHNEGRYQ